MTKGKIMTSTKGDFIYVDKAFRKLFKKPKFIDSNDKQKNNFIIVDKKVKKILRKPKPKKKKKQEGTHWAEKINSEWW